MIDEPTPRQVAQRMVAAAQPTRVIVFGSYGRGDADEGSDLGILVIQPEVTDQVAEMARLRLDIGSVGIGVDVLVYPEAEYRRRSRVPGTLLYWARKEGRTLYATTSYGGPAIDQGCHPRHESLRSVEASTGH